MMREILSTPSLKIAGLVAGALLIPLFMVGSILFGLTDITWSDMTESFTHYNNSKEHIVIQHYRLPRALIATSVGASLAIAGALMQGLMRNPLASPSIFGVNAGASFAVVLSVTLFAASSLETLTWMAFAGAAGSSLVVYLLGSVGRDGLSPIKMTLAGAAMAALFSSLTQGLLVSREKQFEEVMFWLAGSVEGRPLEFLISVLPYLLLGWTVAYLVAKPMNVLMMGEDVAKGLGQRTLLLKVAVGLAIVLLAGGSVAIAGPIWFVGLVVPHLARGLAGTDYRWLIPYSGLLGAMLLLSADIGARYLIMPKEVPVGVMTALIGTPFFIYIARRGLMSHE